MAIPINSKMKPRVEGQYALVDAEDIEYEGGRLPDFLFKCITEDEYNALKAAGKLNDNTPYLIIEG